MLRDKGCFIYYRNMPRVLLGFLFFVPFFASANVVLNEIAWMGTSESSTNEWIELYNNGSASVDLTGWTLTAADGAPSIALSGLILPDGYYLIERTDDDSVPNIAADLVTAFGSGLSNAGEILRLSNAASAVVDTVDGSGSWASVGGDNTTKDTAQRTTSGWITALPTPRAKNPGFASQAGSVTETSTGSLSSTSTTVNSAPGSSGGSSGSSGGGSASAPSYYPRKNISVDAGEDRHILAGLPTPFSGAAHGLYDEDLPYATYRWNFGDGGTGVGKTPEHTYVDMGDYIVTLEVFHSSYHASTRFSVTVTEPTITIDSVTFGERGRVRLSNATKSELDLSGWLLSDAHTSFALPPHTVLLAGKILTLSNVATVVAREEEEKITLAYPDGSIVASWSPEVAKTTSSVITTPAKPTGAVNGATIEKKTNPLSAISISHVTPPLPSSTEEIAAASLFAESGVPGEDPVGSWKWIVGVIAITLFCLAGLVVAKSGVDQATDADKFAILEDVIEGAEEE